MERRATKGRIDGAGARRAGGVPRVAGVLLAAAVLVAALPARAGGVSDPPRDDWPRGLRIEVGLAGGAFLVPSFEAFRPGGGGVLDVRLTRDLGRRARLGARLFLGTGVMDWGYDAYFEWHAGDQAPRGTTLNVIPGLQAFLGIDAARWCTVDLALGLAWTLPVGDLHSIRSFEVPTLAFGAGTVFRVARVGRTDVGVTVRLDYLVGYAFSVHFVLPQAGVTFRF